MSEPTPRATSSPSSRRPAATRRMSTDGGRACRPVRAAARRTTCPYCGVGCGVLATPDGKGGAAIAGDPEHPANSGRLCSKGSALGETLGLETRLLHPRSTARAWLGGGARPRGQRGSRRIGDAARAGGDRLLPLGPAADRGLLRRQQAGEGLHRHAARRHQLAAVHGVLRGRPPPRLRRRRGAAVLRGPGAGRPRGAGRLQRRLVPPGPVSSASRRRAASGGVRVVNIDPRRTATSEGADLQLPIRPGTDAVLWSALLVVAGRAPAASTRASSQSTRGGFAWALRRALRAGADARRRRAATGLDRAGRRAPSTAGSRARRASSPCYSQGVNQSAQGTDKVNAIINCHLATGRIGKPGSGPLSLTGQPNAMGGREVGGLANMLAAHMGFSDAERDRVRRFWDAPNLVARRGPQGRRHVRCRRRRAHQGAVGDGHQPGRVACRAPMRCARRCAKLELLVVSENVAGNDTVAPRACPPARRRLGREGRHRHQLRAPHLAPARLPAAAGRGAARLVDAGRGRAAPGLWRRLRLALGRPRSSRARARSPASRTTGAAPSTSPASPA